VALSLSLKRRAHLNTTSMDSALALYSAAQGLAGPGALCWDPFCGSGSILVALAALGAAVIGSDIDMRAMRASAERSVFANFAQYGLAGRLVGLARADFMRESLRVSGIDAIVCDPPYGIREKCVASDPAPLLPLIIRLYEVAAAALKLGGRLVFWAPRGYRFDAPRETPRHPTLRLVANTMQALSSRYCRHLVTLEKCANVDARVEFDAHESSFLKVRELVFTKFEGYSGKNRKEKRKLTRELKIRLHGLGADDGRKRKGSGA